MHPSEKRLPHLKNRLMIYFIAAALVPVVIVGTALLTVIGNKMDKDIVKKNERFAHHLSEYVEKHIVAHYTALKQISRDIADNGVVSKNEIDRYLKSISQNYQRFDLIKIVDSRGVITHLTPRDESIIGISISHKESFQLPFAENTVYWSKTYISPQTGVNTLTLSVPFNNGVVIGNINLGDLSDITDTVKSGNSGYAAITDKTGVIIAHPDRNLVNERFSVKNLKPVNEALSERFGTFPYRFQGIKKIGSTARISPVGWIACFVQSKEEAFAQKRKMLVIIGIVTILAFIFGALAAFLSLRQILRPLQALTHNAVKITAGDFTYEAGKNSFEEIDLLSRSMETMIEAIQAREKNLHEERLLLNKSQKIARLGSWELDRKTGKILWTDEVYRIFGFEPQQSAVSYEEFLNAVHPDDRAAVDAAYSSSIDEGRDFYEIEHRIVRHDNGEIRFVQEKCNHERDESGNIIRSVGMVHDITDRKQAEKELWQMRNYLSNIIDSMPSMLIGVDPQGKVTQWNSAAVQQTGIRSVEAIGHSFENLVPRFRDEMERITVAIRTRQEQTDLKRARRKDGETRYEDVTIYPLVANGVEGAVIRIDDMTEQVRLEKMMVQSEKMLSVGGLAAGMAHEINNPLAGMMQTADNLTSRLTNMEMPANIKAAETVGIDMEQIAAFMEKRAIPRMVGSIRESGRRVAKIVDNMLSFARKSNSQVSSHNPVELMDKTLALAATDYDLKKKQDFKTIRIEKTYDPDLPWIPCEGAKIQQVLLNIFRNGAQAMQEAAPDGEHRFYLGLSHEKETGMVRIEIKDNGPGMDEETRKRVFEPFFTTKPVGVGTGLGLSVSYFIITENHSGEMAVESTPGEGTTFIIRLPGS